MNEMGQHPLIRRDEINHKNNIGRMLRLLFGEDLKGFSYIKCRKAGESFLALRYDVVADPVERIRLAENLIKKYFGIKLESKMTKSHASYWVALWEREHSEIKSVYYNIYSDRI